MNPNDWYVEKEESDFTVKWNDAEEWYLVYDDLYDEINNLVNSKIKHLPE